MKFIATDEDAGKRLDTFVTQKIPNRTRAFIQKLRTEDKILVNKKTARSSYRLKVDDIVSIEYSETNIAALTDLKILIIYEDNDCVVIVKPLGVLTHSKGTPNPEATVASWLKDRVTGISGDRAGIVHRLDRATSGVMICAKNPQALKKLQKQFSERKVTKTYVAIIGGTLDLKEAVLELPIERNPKAPSTFKVGANGKKAITKYKVIKSNENYSMLNLTPETGRTHQLRVHLQYLKHPIIGDSFYGGKTADRLFLHALSLGITLPDRKYKVFVAPLPDSFYKIMKSTKNA